MSNPLAPGLLKLGQTTDVERRARDLSACQCFHLQVEKVWPGLGRLEQLVHNDLSVLRHRDGPGIEWFKTDLATVQMCVDMHLAVASQRVTML